MEDVETMVLDYPLPSPTALAPPAGWDRLREECPVANIRFPSSDSLMTRYDDVKQVLSDPRFTHALDATDVECSPNPHLTFGAGAHSDLGQAPARTELEVLLRRLPTLEPDESVKLKGLIVGSLTEVPVRW